MDGARWSWTALRSIATSGGQPFDTGWIEFVSAESEEPVALSQSSASPRSSRMNPSGTILHVVEKLEFPLPSPLRVRGFIDVDRRQDHMQQHSGQHVLSAAFLKLFDAPTVSFHLGEESCTIDLDIAGLNPDANRTSRAPRQSDCVGRSAGADA